MLMVETLLDNIDLIIDAGIELILALAEGLLDALPDLIDKIPIIIEKLVVAITNNLPKLLEMGIKLLIELSIGLIKAIPQLVSKVPQIISALVSGIKSGLGSLATVGGNLISGLWNGISDKIGWIKDKIRGFGQSVLNSIKSIFGIHSPSTVFRDEVGKNLALGLGEGFADTMADVTTDMQGAIPTEFDANIHTNTSTGYSSASNFDTMVMAFKQALTEMKVEMNGREMGAFVEERFERVVYA
jgi:phage-related protein